MGFEKHGEIGIARGDGKEIRGAFSLLPEGGADLGTAAREKKRARGGFAEFRSEQGCGAELANDEVLGCRWIGKQEGGVRGHIGVGEAENEAIVGRHGFDVGSAGILNLGGGGHSPGRVDAIAKRRKDADAPITELVADALDDDGAVIGNRCGGGCLVGEELD